MSVRIRIVGKDDTFFFSFFIAATARAPCCSRQLLTFSTEMEDLCRRWNRVNRPVLALPLFTRLRKKLPTRRENLFPVFYDLFARCGQTLYKLRDTEEEKEEDERICICSSQIYNGEPTRRAVAYKPWKNSLPYRLTLLIKICPHAVFIFIVHTAQFVVVIT